uniref:RING-type domain-containing protein n=1 Tax=Steinernema glaseri TaxID=37863 RepID=A0A1I8AM81_9BILA
MFSSAIHVDDRIFCLENSRFYAESDVEGDRGRTLRPLTIVNDATKALDSRPERSFVREDIVYSLYTSSTDGTRLLQLNLQDCTVGDVTDKVENLSDIRNVFDGTEDDGTIYFLGLDKDRNRVLWKVDIVLPVPIDNPIQTAPLGVFPDSILDDFCCGICHEPFEVPKVFPCGHTICASCEGQIGKKTEKKGKEKKKLTCPFCQRSVLLEADETLPTNYALQNVIESLMSNSEILEDSFLCSTCGTRQKKENYFYCRTCSGAAKTEKKSIFAKAVSLLPCRKDTPLTTTDKKNVAFSQVLVCGKCAFLKHIDHDYAPETLSNRRTKENALPVEHWEISAKDAFGILESIGLLEDMKVTKVVDLPDTVKESKYFAVIDQSLYYTWQGRLRKYNTSTGEEKEVTISFAKLAFVHAVFCVNGRINVLVSNGDSSYFFLELEFDIFQPEFVKVGRTRYIEGFCIREGFRLWSPSIVQVGDSVFCLENYRFFEGIYQQYNLFTWRDEMCFVTKEDEQFFFNSFPLECKSRRTAIKPLDLLDNGIYDLEPLHGSFVHGNAVYSFFYFQSDMVKDIFSRCLRWNLRDSTAEDVTGKVAGLKNIIQNICSCAQEGATIYMKDDGGILWKMEMEPHSDISDAATDDRSCRICREPFELPKVFPCGHTICADCESKIGVENEENKKTLVCPFCKKSVVLEANANLPTNFDLMNAIESSMPNLQIREDSFLCSTCRERQKKKNCFYCRTCTITAPKVNETK